MPFIKNVAIFAKKVPPTPPKSPEYIVLSGGEGFSLYINTQGRSWSWGNNEQGQLGNNTTVLKLTPISVLGAVKTFCHIIAADNFSMAIDKNGRAWTWGNNSSGQLGDNSFSQRSTPVSVAGAVKTFCKISAGSGFSLAIAKNGRAWAWGNNGNGQLGTNNTINQRTPVSVLGTVKTFCEISAGLFYSLAIDKNGRAWAWGNNNSGVLGNNDATATQRCTPVSVCGSTKTFCKISGGSNHSLVIDKNGKAWSWGQNNNGQLGDNSLSTRLTPVSVGGLVKTFCQISAGPNFSLAIDKDGRAWGWGINDFGQLGDNTLVSKRTPVSIRGSIKTFCEISTGKGTQERAKFSLAIDHNGGVWSWGKNSLGALGDATAEFSSSPVSILGVVKTFCEISAGSLHVTAIDKNGRVWSWGNNGSGQLGDNTTIGKKTPISVLGLVKTFCKIATRNNNHVIAIDKNGRAWAWGVNSNGELGDNTTGAKFTPVSVCGAVKTFCEISGGTNHSLAIDKNGRAWAWGANFQGRLGNNSTISQRTPVSVCGSTKTFCKISGGSDFSVAIDKNGRAWAWGANFQGRLGNNSTISQQTPVSVCGSTKTFCKIDAGSFHVTAIDKNGRAWSWGANFSGQLGNNSTTSQQTPVSVCGSTKTFCEIATSGAYSVGIDKNGRAWAWGFNGSGQLGDNSFTQRNTPVSVVGVVKTFCKIMSSAGHTMAIDKNGRVWGWGSDDYGQLAQNYSRLTPVRVCVI